jgi:hypothetical protein
VAAKAAVQRTPILKPYPLAAFYSGLLFDAG